MRGVRVHLDSADSFAVAKVSFNSSFSVEARLSPFCRDSSGGPDFAGRGWGRGGSLAARPHLFLGDTTEEGSQRAYTNRRIM